MSSVNRDLFISHSSGDAEVARALRTELEDAGYTCWLAPDDVVGTDPWAEQILAAIAGSRAMLVLVSERSNRSQHVSREVGLANGRNRAIIPVRIEHVPIAGSLEYHLEGLQRIDAFPPPITGHIPRILRRLATIVPLEGTVSNVPGAAIAAVAASPPASTDTQRVHVVPPPPPPPVVVAGAAATPVGPRRPRWVPPVTGLSGALATLVALIVLGAGAMLIRPSAASPTDSPSSTLSVAGSPGSSQPPASSAGTSPSASPSPAAETSSPEPSPTRTRRPDPPPVTPAPTPKVTKKPTQPPPPPPTPTPVPATVPARIVSHSNGATINGPNVDFSWTAASGPKSVRYYSVYVGSTPPSDPCSGWCREPGDDAYASSNIDYEGGMDPGTTSTQIGNLPMDGNPIYVRLFTKYNPADGVLAWRDYTFTSAP